jgi:hypothetical protein
MRWHKEGIRENDGVMVHIFRRWGMKCARQLWCTLFHWCKKCLLRVGDRWLWSIQYKLRTILLLASLYCSVQPNTFSLHEIWVSEAVGPRLNMMLKSLIEELEQLWIGVEVYDCYKKQKSTFERRTCGLSMILRHTTFLLVGVFTENWHVRYVVQT